jgi:very-short-patch-repair endonuclease
MSVGSLKLTGNHPVWTDSGYIEASHLTAGQQVAIISGQDTYGTPRTSLRVLRDDVHAEAEETEVLFRTMRSGVKPEPRRCLRHLRIDVSRTTREQAAEMLLVGVCKEAGVEGSPGACSQVHRSRQDCSRYPGGSGQVEGMAGVTGESDLLPEVRRRAAVTQRLNGYKNLNWKHSTTEAQRILSIALGWGTEVTIKTNDLSGRARSRTERAAFRPHYYNLDIADPVLKIAIEVDGNSHRCKERQQRDARRESFLLSQGWVLLRFTNKRVLSDLDGVLQEVLEAVRSTTSRPPQGTTSLTDS